MAIEMKGFCEFDRGYQLVTTRESLKNIMDYTPYDILTSDITGALLKMGSDEVPVEIWITGSVKPRRYNAQYHRIK